MQSRGQGTCGNDERLGRAAVSGFKFAVMGKERNEESWKF